MLRLYTLPTTRYKKIKIKLGQDVKVCFNIPTLAGMLFNNSEPPHPTHR